MPKKLFSRRNQTPDRLSDLEERLKLNRGAGVSFAQDTGAQPGFILPYARTSKAPVTDVIPTYQQRQAVLPPTYEEPIFEQPLSEGEPSQDLSSLQGFFNEFSNSLYRPESVGSPSVAFLERLYQATGQTYGVQSLPDGRIRMNDGSIQDPNVQLFPIQSLPDGSVRMSDGSVRQLNPQIAAQIYGVEGLSQGIFGSNQTITQPFGSYNPGLEPGSGYNLGTDFRTRDLRDPSIYFPVPAEVVQVLYDDGTRWGDISGHQGYGNSVLLRLSTGEMLRLSHLSQLGNLQPGQRINAGTFIGTPGATGNTTGEHLDLEYYNRNGQIDNPENFTGFVDPMQFLPQQQSIGSSQVSSQPQQPPTTQPNQSVPTQPQKSPTMVTDAVRTVPQKLSQVVQQTKNAPGQILGTSIERLNPTGDLGIGFSEFSRGDLPGAGRELSRAIETVNPPIPDTGISELLAGRPGEAREKFNNLLARVKARTDRVPQQIASTIIPQVQADSGEVRTPTQSLGENIQGAMSSVGRYIDTKTQPLQDIGSNALQAAGSGIDRLKNLFTGMTGGTTTRPSASDISGKREIGDSPRGTNLLGIPPAQQTGTKNDIRDPFFRSGMAQQYQGFLKPGAMETGALSLDIFKPEFFQNQGNVSGVFGGTNLAGAAQGRYDAYQEELRRKAEEEARNRPSLDDYLRMGKTAAQYYAETGQQSTADQMRKQGINLDLPYTPGNANYSAPSGQAVYAPPPTQTPSGSKTAARAISYGPSQNYTPANANYSSASGVASYVPAPQSQAPSLFSRISQNISKLFRK